ncbi:MAG: CdaR family protein [Polyangiaceae bacterium]|nr:CdaR family protein [Polyangiaceae bacterium]
MAEKTTIERVQRALTKNLGLKVLALIFALGFFGYVRGQENEQQRTIPIGVVSLPPEAGSKELMSPIPASIQITVRGSSRIINALLEQGVPPVELDLREGYPKQVSFQKDMFSLPPGLSLVLVDPPRLDLEWEAIILRQISLHASITGQPADGYTVEGSPTVDPSRVTVRGPLSRVEVMQFARLAPFDVSGLSASSWTRRIAIEPPPPLVSVLGTQAATVTVDVVRRSSEKLFADRPVEVIGPTKAKVLPANVDLTVIGPPEVVQALKAEQLVPQADLSGLGPWEKKKEHGSTNIKVSVSVNNAEVQVQPPSVTVKW